MELDLGCHAKPWSVRGIDEVHARSSYTLYLGYEKFEEVQVDRSQSAETMMLRSRADFQ